MRLDEIIQQHAEKLSPQLQAEVFDFVLFLEQKQASARLTTDPQQRKKRLEKAMDNAVALGVFAGVDGVQWQNEQRQDRNIGYSE